jgi:hypothetical protein
MRALSANRQAAAMTQAAITTDVHETLYIHLDALSQIALDLALPIDDGADLIEFVLVKIADLCVDIHSGFVQYRSRPRFSDTVDIGQTYLRSFVRW